MPLSFHPAAKTPSKTPCFRAFIRGSFKSPFAFSPVYILCIASYSFLSAYRHFFYPASPCAFTRCFFVSLPFLASLCPVLCLPKKLRSEFLQKSPGARVSYLLGIPVCANHLPFYSACTRFVLFFLFPYIFCFHRRHAGFICIKKQGRSPVLSFSACGMRCARSCRMRGCRSGCCRFSCGTFGRRRGLFGFLRRGRRFFG